MLDVIETTSIQYLVFNTLTPSFIHCDNIFLRAMYSNNNNSDVTLLCLCCMI